MKLSEYLSEFNLFEELNTLHPELGLENPNILDGKLLMQYGQRTMFSTIINIPRPTLLSLIHHACAPKWTELDRKQELLAGNLNTRIERTETTNKVENVVGTSTSTEKVAAYNDTELVENGGNQNNNSNDVVGETIKTIVDEHIDVEKNLKLLNLSKDESTIETIVSDVANFLTLSVY